MRQNQKIMSNSCSTRKTTSRSEFSEKSKGGMAEQESQILFVFFRSSDVDSWDRAFGQSEPHFSNFLNTHLNPAPTVTNLLKLQNF